LNFLLLKKIMNIFLGLFSFIWRIPYGINWRIRSWLISVPLIMRLSWNNRRHHKKITQPEGPVVSMTTYGQRLRTVYIAIESIARGKALPSKIILWIDDQKLFDNLPASICRLIERGLEVKFCKNYGPHTKYYPYVASCTNCNNTLVIADDDQIYPKWWLARLIEAYQKFPYVINCHWAVKIKIETQILKYKTWKLNGYIKPSYTQMALGVSGVIYPPELLKILKTCGTSFQNCCPKADDIWLHVQAIRAGYKIRQIRKKRLCSPYIPGSQRFALAHENNYGGNDRQIAATYTNKDIKKMLDE